MTNPMNLDDRVLIITGAGQGIGKATAELALALGARLALIDLRADGIDELAGAHGAARVQAFTGSVADAGFVQDTVETVVRQFGRIDGLMNNAGIIRPAMIHKMPVGQWQEVIDVNLTGVFLVLQAVGRHMLDRVKAGEVAADGAAGTIVNVSSDAGRRGSIGQINYGAAKSGVLGITMSAAREWAGRGIRVNSVCFGVVETAMTETIRGDKFRDTYLAQVPMGRFSSPDEVAKPVCFLLSDAASYITGQHLSINGGYHIGV